MIFPFERIVVLAFLLIAVLLAIDLYDDMRHGSDLGHIAMEGTALLLSGFFAARALVTYLRQLLKRQEAFESTLRDITAERDRWRSRSEEHLRGLGTAIDTQFDEWSLSTSEKEIGLLILKGFSHKEIAEIRKTSERTVRQQAGALYGKAGIQNKAQLSAFFLEDLMLPGREEPIPTTSSAA